MMDYAMARLVLLLYFMVRSDIARVYVPGTEPAKGGQDIARPYPPGLEKAHPGNSNLAHNYGDLDK